MCTGRVDLAFLFRAFQQGADGVIIGGCWPGECHYVTEGNYDALGNVLLGKRILDHIGLRPDRLRIEWIAASEGTRFAEVMSDFVAKMAKLGPLGKAEGVPEGTLALRLGAVGRLIPYLKLVEREKLRVERKSEEAYQALHDADDTKDLFRDLIADPLATSQILSLLAECPLSTPEIAERMGLGPSETARYLGSSSRRGLIRFDVARQRYALALVPLAEEGPSASLGRG